MKIFSIKFGILMLLIIALCFTACASKRVISDELSPAELIQRAQEAADRNRYNRALQFYEALYERNINNIDLVITAKYEIAFIQYKQKKFQEARAGLNEVLEYYNTPDAILLPQQFRRLAEIVLGSITRKEQRFVPRSQRPRNEEQESEFEMGDEY